VDFKIEQKVFGARSTFKDKAELAKDICALSNNWLKSYLLIGVSNDGKNFKSNQNIGLTDDNLQRFCRDAINPSPIVQLQSLTWQTSNSNHRNKEFVVIQVGPHAPGTVFRLSKDFIDWPSQVYYRKNEVWIRRGATSDLASPEEIVGLSQKQKFDTTKSALDLKAERERFLKRSLIEQCTDVNHLLFSTLESMHFRILKGKTDEWITAPVVNAPILNPVLFEQRTEKQITFVVVCNCLRRIDSKWLNSPYWLGNPLTLSEEQIAVIATRYKRKSEQSLKAIRSIVVQPVLQTVSDTKLSMLYSRNNRRSQGHFVEQSTRAAAKLPDSLGNKLSVSLEYIVISRILSLTELEARLKVALAEGDS
jgi:hypothetical protein